MGKYDDIINLPHHRSPYRTPMPIENRAAQFAPFAALSGHEEAISETSRLTTKRIELTNEEKIELSKNIAEAFSARHPVTITYFIPDSHKEGGRYSTTTGIIIKIDETDKTLTLSSGLTLLLSNLLHCRISDPNGTTIY